MGFLLTSVLLSLGFTVLLNWGLRRRRKREPWNRAPDRVHRAGQGPAGKRTRSVYSEDAPGREYAERAKAELDADELESATKEGWSLSVKEALALARATNSSMG